MRAVAFCKRLIIMFTNSWTQNPENKINYTHE